MLLKDQLKIRMDELDMGVTELARRVGVSSQSVRHWIGGRSFPGKAKCPLVESALSFKMDFSEGQSVQSVTVDDALQRGSVEAFAAISRLPAPTQLIFQKLALAFSELQAKSSTAASQAQRPVSPSPVNHGRRMADRMPEASIPEALPRVQTKAAVPPAVRASSRKVAHATLR
jgi:hypothetical protein